MQIVDNGGRSARTAKVTEEYSEYISAASFDFVSIGNGKVLVNLDISDEGRKLIVENPDYEVII